MAISYISSADVQASTLTMPAHQIGDMLIMFAYRENNTPPTTPAGWTILDSPTGANTNSAAVAYKIAGSASETSGTWTNASMLVCAVYRGVSHIGAHAVNNGASATVSYPALTLDITDGTSWVVGFAGHRSVNGSVATAPTGMTNRNSLEGTTSDGAVHDTNGGVASWSARTVVTTETASGFYVARIELVEAIKSHTFVDNFDAPVDINTWAFSGGATQPQGRVRLDHTTGPDYQNLYTHKRYDLTESSVHVKVVDFGNQALATHVVQLMVSPRDLTDLNHLRIEASGGYLQFYKYIGGSQTWMGDAPLDEYKHSWLRIRESGGTTYYDASPDGVIWTNLYSFTNEFPMNALGIVLQTGCYAAEASGSYAIYDYLNAQALPKAHTFWDDFSSGINESVWTKGNDPVQVYPSSGRVRVDHGIGVDYNFLHTTDRYDLTESMCFVEIADVGNQTLENHEVSLIVFLDENYQFNFYVNEGMLGIFLNFNGTPVGIGEIAYNATNHRWLRVRETDSTLYFDVSPDGIDWTTLLTQGTYFNVTAVQLMLLAGAGAGDASGSYGVFDNFNTRGLPKVDTLKDNFTGGSLDAAKWSADWASGGDATVVDGRLRLQTGSSAYAWSVVFSNNYFDLTDSAVYVQIPDPGNRPTNWAARIAVTPESGTTDWVRMYVSDVYGVVTQISNNDSLIHNDGTSTYDPAVHRWIRIRESSGVIYFGFSADGIDWTEEFSSGAVNWNMTAIQVSLEAQIAEVLTPMTTYFDHLNTPWNGPVFRSAAELAVGSPSASVQLPVPADVVADDILLAFIFLKNGNGDGIPPQTMSSVASGFTAMTPPFEYDGDRDVKIFAYWKRATGADVGTYNFTLSSSHLEFSGYTMRYSGCVATGTPFDSSTDWDANNSDTTQAVSVTTQGDSRLLVHVNVSNGGFRIATAGAGYVLDASGPDDDSSHGWGVLSREQDAVGSSGSVVADWNPSHYGVSVSGLFALRSSSAVGKNTEFFFLYDS